MAEKNSVYVDHNLHRLLKAEASLRGKSLSEFMVDAALSALHSPRRQESAARMDAVRDSVRGYVSSEEIHDMRSTGSRGTPYPGRTRVREPGLRKLPCGGRKEVKKVWRTWKRES